MIEDCAHTMGATFRGVPSGRHGRFGCYSTQTYKHMNSGEGGFLISDDAEAMARAVLLSGSYMLYARHRAAPPPEVFERLRLVTPNISGRMDNLRAAILRPQIALLEDRRARWEALYRRLEAGLAGTPGLAPDPAARGRTLRRIVLPVPAARLAGRSRQGAAGADCGAGGGAEVVRRGRSGRLHLAL